MNDNVSRAIHVLNQILASDWTAMDSTILVEGDMPDVLSHRFDRKIVGIYKVCAGRFDAEAVAPFFRVYGDSVRGIHINGWTGVSGDRCVGMTVLVARPE